MTGIRWTICFSAALLLLVVGLTVLIVKGGVLGAILATVMLIKIWKG